MIKLTLYRRWAATLQLFDMTFVLFSLLGAERAEEGGFGRRQNVLWFRRPFEEAQLLQGFYCDEVSKIPHLK